MTPFTLDAKYTFEQVMMTLAAIAYTPNPSEISQQLAVPEYATQNQWNLVWGPVYTLDGLDVDNLLYVVKYNSPNSNIFAVVIRGTVLSYDLSTLVDLFEDLDVSVMDAWTYPNVPGALVANGTLTGLDILTDMRDYNTGQTLLQFLSSQPGSAVCVTGHSLGGCLTTVLAPWLAYQFEQYNIRQLVVPCSFAAPTAGNQAFATWYNQAFPAPTYRYYNSIDAIPMAWNNLNGIKALFPGGPACPWALKDLISLVQDWLYVSDATYAQTNAAGNALPGTVLPNSSWFANMEHQHDHNTYLTLLGAPNVQLSVTASVSVKQHHPSLLKAEKPI
ncbi:lipase family protein [Chitinophaga rhizophila]|uniref:Lipase family protein n=1 Tax=Chitinophaga rhizophila TaxID=2866212 RepID=A0ABS7GAR2_9BACT|nr:lipase family protein [Chitinophaga rhizophila]MBW8684761.1 lipase family protein [Chitinophaga rhizophila]